MSKGQKNTSAVATVDTAIPTIVSMLEQKLTEIKKITDSPYKTSGQFSANGITLDLKSETKIERLVEAFAAAKSRSKAVTDAQIELGVKTMSEYRVGGFPLDDWKHDIKLRIAIIEQEETTKKLSSYKEKFAALMTQEDQKALLIQQFQAEFGK